jgi:hypothetical protein
MLVATVRAEYGPREGILAGQGMGGPMGTGEWVAVGVAGYVVVVSAVLLVFRAGARADASMEAEARRRLTARSTRRRGSSGGTHPHARAG